MCRDCKTKKAHRIQVTDTLVAWESVVDTRHSHMIGGGAGSMNIVSNSMDNSMDDKPKVDVNVEVCTWSNIEQWKVLFSM